MLLSQRIAGDPKFLFNGNGVNVDIFDLRMRIINATKLVVPHEFLNFDTDYLDNLTQVFKNSSAKSFDTKADMYKQYSRMPFPSMFIENDTGGMLVTQTTTGFTVRAIAKTGLAHPYLANFKGWPANGSIPVPEITYNIKKGRELSEEYEKPCRIGALIHTYVSMEVMLFMNVKNITVHQYVPTVKENNYVPKPLRSKYVYRVLDVFNDVVRYESLGQITDQLIHTGKTAEQRRSSLVRGHFKEFKNGLFGKESLAGLYWWNIHRRNRKNRESVGEVEKDYRLVA